MSFKDHLIAQSRMSTSRHLKDMSVIFLGSFTGPIGMGAAIVYVVASHLREKEEQRVNDVWDSFGLPKK